MPKFKLVSDKPKEADIQRACLQTLAHAGFVVLQPPRRKPYTLWQALSKELAQQKPRGLVWRENTIQIGYVQAGIPGRADIQGVLADGRFLAIEVKRPGKLPDPEQLAYLDCIDQMGGVATWVSSTDELRAWLRTNLPLPTDATID